MSVYAGQCQSGAGGQVEGGGFNVVNSEQFCDLLKLSEHLRVSSEYARDQGDIDKALEYRLQSYKATEDAMKLLNDTSWTGFINRLGGQLVIPSALIAGLILLL
jgi:hypothetical protein